MIINCDRLCILTSLFPHFETLIEPQFFSFFL